MNILKFFAKEAKTVSELINQERRIAQAEYNEAIQAADSKFHSTIARIEDFAHAEFLAIEHAIEALHKRAADLLGTGVINPTSEDLLLERVKTLAPKDLDK